MIASAFVLGAFVGLVAGYVAGLVVCALAHDEMRQRRDG